MGLVKQNINELADPAATENSSQLELKYRRKFLLLLPLF